MSDKSCAIGLVSVLPWGGCVGLGFSQLQFLARSLFVHVDTSYLWVKYDRPLKLFSFFYIVIRPLVLVAGLMSDVGHWVMDMMLSTGRQILSFMRRTSSCSGLHHQSTLDEILLGFDQQWCTKLATSRVEFIGWYMVNFIQRRWRFLCATILFLW